MSVEPAVPTVNLPRVNAAQFQLFDYSVFAARDLPDAVGALTAVTGRHEVPPEWALGPTLYRGIRVLSAESDDAASYERKVRADKGEAARNLRFHSGACGGKGAGELGTSLALCIG